MIVNPGVRRFSGGLFGSVRRILLSITDGALYDPSSISSLNQLSTGTTPVTAVTYPVGLLLDSRFGLVLGEELMPGGGTLDSGTGWTQYSGVIGGGVLTVVADTINNCSLETTSNVLTVGKFYKVVYVIDSITGSVGMAVGGVNTAVATAPGTYTEYITAAIAACRVYTRSAGASYVISNISVKLLEGNHALQATAAARPTWTNRVNQALSTEVVSANWTSISCSVEELGNGLMRVTSTAPSARFGAVSSGMAGIAFNETITVSATIYTTASDVILRAFEGGTGLHTDTAVNNSNIAQRYSVTRTLSAAGMSSLIDEAFMPTSGTVIYYQYPQIEPGTTATRYQRVTTDTDFDTVGFPYYLSFLGIDDSLTSATGGGGSAGFFWCGVVEPTGGAGTLRTIWADNGTNTGYKVQLDASNKLSFSAGNNTAFTTKASTATLTTKSIATVWDDGTNLNVKINSVAAETVGRPVVVAGTAGFTVGKDNGAASNFFIGNLYPSLYVKGSGLTATQRASVQAFIMAKGGL